MATRDAESHNSHKTEHGRRGYGDSAASQDPAGEDVPGLRRGGGHLSDMELDFSHLSVSESDPEDASGARRVESSGSHAGGDGRPDDDGGKKDGKLERRCSGRKRAQRARRSGNTTCKTRCSCPSPCDPHSVGPSDCPHAPGRTQRREAERRQRDPGASSWKAAAEPRRNKRPGLPQSTEVGEPPPIIDHRQSRTSKETSPVLGNVAPDGDGTANPWWRQRRASRLGFRAETLDEPRRVENPWRPDILNGLGRGNDFGDSERLQTSSDGVPGAFQDRAASPRSWYEEEGQEREEDLEDYVDEDGEADEAGENGNEPEGVNTLSDDEDHAYHTARSEDENEVDGEDEDDANEHLTDVDTLPEDEDDPPVDDTTSYDRAPKRKDPTVHERDLKLVRAYGTANGRLALGAVVQIRLMRALTQIRQPASRDQYQNAYECALAGLDLAMLALETDAGQQDIESLSRIVAQAHYYAGLAAHLAGPDGFERALDHLRSSLEYAADRDATGRSRAEQVMNNILRYQHDPTSINAVRTEQDEAQKSSRWAWFRGTLGSISSMASSLFGSTPYENGVVPKGRRLDSQMLDGEASPGRASSLKSVSAVGGAVRSRSSANGSTQRLYIPPHSVSLGVSLGTGPGLESVRSQTGSPDSNDENIPEVRPVTKRMTISITSTDSSGTFARPAPQRMKTAPSKLSSGRSSSAKVSAARSDSSRADGSASAMLGACSRSPRPERRSIQENQPVSSSRFRAPIASNSKQLIYGAKTAAIPTTITEEREVMTLKDAHGVRTVKKFSDYQFAEANEPPGEASPLPKLHGPDLPWRTRPHQDYIVPNEAYRNDRSPWPEKSRKTSESIPLTEEPEDYPQGFYEAGFRNAQYVEPYPPRSWQMEDFVLPVQGMGLDPDYVEGQEAEDREEDDAIKDTAEWQQKERMAKKAVFPKLEQIFREFARETISVMQETLSREEMFEFCHDVNQPLLRRKAWEIVCNFKIGEAKGTHDHLPPMPPAPRPPKATLVAVNRSPISPPKPPTPTLAKAKLVVVNRSPTSPRQTNARHRPAKVPLAVVNASPRAYAPTPTQTPQPSAPENDNINNTIVSPPNPSAPRSPKLKRAVVNELPSEPVTTPDKPSKRPQPPRLWKTRSSTTDFSSSSKVNSSRSFLGDPPTPHLSTPPSLSSPGSPRAENISPSSPRPNPTKWTLPPFHQDSEDDIPRNPSPPSSPLTSNRERPPPPPPSSSTPSPPPNPAIRPSSRKTPNTPSPSSASSAGAHPGRNSSIPSDPLGVATGTARGAAEAEDAAGRGESLCYAPADGAEGLSRRGRWLSLRGAKDREMVEEGRSAGFAPEGVGERGRGKRKTV